jgi:hypothetical protein
LRNCHFQEEIDLEERKRKDQESQELEVYNKIIERRNQVLCPVANIAILTVFLPKKLTKKFGSFGHNIKQF